MVTWSYYCLLRIIIIIISNLKANMFKQMISIKLEELFEIYIWIISIRLKWLKQYNYVQILHFIR